MKELEVESSRLKKLLSEAELDKAMLEELAWIESFNGRLRDELLNGWHFDSLLEAQVLIEDWRVDYNINTPHSAHGDPAPAEYVIHCNTRHQPIPA